MIKAKPVIANRYWILRKDGEKVGAVEATDDGYRVRIQNRVQQFKNIPSLRRTGEIEFVPPAKITRPAPGRVHGYDTGCRVYNAMWNLRYKLPLFTKTAKSKSWFAAGWYAVRQNRHWRIERNPKLIVLERYQFHGPFHNEDQARESIQ